MEPTLRSEMILDGQDYPAPGKLNLFLHVVGQREDGYHLLQTVFRLLDFGDVLRFRVRRDATLTRVNPLPGVPDESDLTVRAARALQVATGAKLGVDIEIKKFLPMGGGMGGGSSNAATTLLALNRLWNTGLSRERLMDIGLSLGADVPLFIYGQSSFAEGIGERLQAISLAPAWYVILRPAVAVSTREIFGDPELTRTTKPIKLTAFSAGQMMLAEEHHNDLEPVVTKRYPEVARHLAWLRQFGDARMTGSGSCVFCAFTTKALAREVLHQLPKDMQGFVAAGYDRHPLFELAAN
jgi:4-diphosphocytidyl-2-C-methyl-D-erythritol kinase